MARMARVVVPFYPHQVTQLGTGIVILFGDKSWARQEYDRLDGELQSAGDKARLSESRRQRLETHFY